jgi:hypothetical protein
MKRFNRNEAVKVVVDVMDKHIQQYGNILYNASGQLPYENDKKYIPNNSYSIFRNKCKQSLVTLYGHNSVRMYEFLEMNLSCFIKSKFNVGLVIYNHNNRPQYVEPK